MKNTLITLIKQNISIYILLIIIISLIAHFLFSWMGFCPTDDGFVLAYSRRILEGQVPHRDFISIRPVGSALLHLPFVFLGGDYTYWISRYIVWVEFACIACAWLIIFSKILNITLGTFEKVILIVIAFIFTSHNFPIMAWSTVDGLFLISVGLVFCLRESKASKMLGYTLIGMAYLCKQNFLVIAPISIIALGDQKQKKYWLMTAVPGIAYFCYLFFTSAIPDAIIQLGTQTSLIDTGVKAYIKSKYLWLGTLLGYLAVCLKLGEFKIGFLTASTNTQKIIGIITLYTIPLIVAASQSLRPTYHYPTSFLLFGAIAGTTIYYITHRDEEKRFKYIAVGILVLATAWSVSISLGYNTPALAAGPMAILLIFYAKTLYIADRNKLMKRLYVLLSVVMILIAIPSYIYERQEYIYLERPAEELNKKLDAVFPGGNLIKTNPVTYDFLADLRFAIDKAGKTRYAIIPDLAGYWVKSPQVNPLPIDWAQGYELNEKSLFDRVTKSLENDRGSLTIITQKVTAESLATNVSPINNIKLHGIVYYVRSHFKKTGETKFFDLYK